MNIVRRLLLLGVSLSLAGLLGGCASTRLIAAARAPGYSGGPIASLLVVVISDDPQARRSFEAAFVRAFRQRGAAAQSALEALGADAPTTREAMTAAVRLGAGGLFLARLLETKEEEVYTAPIYYDREFIHGTYVYVYSPTMTGYVLREGYYTTYQYYRMESALYSVKSGEPIWSARSETEDPASPDKAMAGLAQVVADNLKKLGLLP